MSCMKNDCTLLLNSYDDGDDCWDIFFKSIDTQWPQMDLPIVLNTESKKYSYGKYDIETFALFQRGEKVPWGKRLIETLNRINSEYVLTFLEDNWLDKPVNDDLFRKALGYMKLYPDISVITLSYAYDKKHPNIKDNRIPGFERRPQKCFNKLNAQVSIWRRERLVSYTRSHENPWEWEVFGSERASRYNESFYVLSEGIELPFSYKDFMYPNGNPRDGVISMGKWDIDMVDKFSSIYDLSNIDFSKRGFYDWNERRNISFLAKKWEELRKIPYKLTIEQYRRRLSLK